MDVNASAIDNLTTTPFHDTPGKYVRRIMAMWLGRWWWTMALPVALTALLSVIEAVWLFVALMILCLLVPAVIAMVYYNYALTPQAVATLELKIVSISDNSLVVTYCDKEKTEKIFRSNIKSVEDTGKLLVVRLKNPEYSHLAIPLKAIPDHICKDFVEKAMNLA